MHRLHRALMVALASCLLASPASAQLVSFTFSGGFSASWTLPQSPTPDFANGVFFALDDVGIEYEGAPRSVGLEFYSEEFGGGVCLIEADLCSLGDLFGATLFAGTTANPEFLLGTFELLDANTDSDVRLVIERVAEVPEPSVLLLLGVGVAALAGAGAVRMTA